MKGITPYIGGKWFIFTRDTFVLLYAVMIRS